MTWSGLLIYWAYQPYRIGWGNMTILKFFPGSFHRALNIPYRLAEGMSIHFTFMWPFAITGFLYVTYLFLSGAWRAIFPDRKSFSELGRVILTDLHLSKKKLPVREKYNAAQRVIYSGVLLLGFLSLLSGMAIYKPVQLSGLCSLLGGYAAARMEHFIITLLFALFFLIHLIQVLRAGWNRFRSMMTGFEVANDTDRDPQCDKDEAKRDISD